MFVMRPAECSCGAILKRFRLKRSAAAIDNAHKLLACALGCKLLRSDADIPSDVESHRMEGDVVAAATQVSVKLSTQLPEPFKVPEDALIVPANLTRLGLSQVVNSLLELDPAQPFDFLISGELLRQPLEKFLLAHNVSTETLLNIEYFKAVVPPRLKSEVLHDDWVSAIDGTSQGSILTGSYDGILRLWNEAGVLISFSQAHKGGVNAVQCLPSFQGSFTLSAGKDHSIRLWAIPEQAMQSTDGEALSCAAVYKGHTDAVEAVAASPSGSSFCSGSWDANVHIWRTGREVAAAAQEAAPTTNKAVSKKRKLGKAADVSSAAAEGPLQEEPRATLQGHSQCVAGVSWPEEESIYTGSWDHSVRRWDAETLVNTATWNSSKAIYCIAAEAASPALVAFGGADLAWRLWDSRQDRKQELGVKVFSSHTDWISSIAWSHISPHCILTTSYDKTAKLWDLRSSIPLQTLEGHGDKVLCGEWISSKAVATGGADCKLMLFNMQNSKS